MPAVIAEPEPRTEHPTASPLRAWVFLGWFSFRRLGRVRQMVGIAIALLALTSLVVALVTTRFGWDRTESRLRRSDPRNIQFVVGSVAGPVIDSSPLMEELHKENHADSVFSRWVVFFLFMNFLMPLWTLSFATSALGTDRESRSMVWLLTRPLPKGSIYSAKFLAVLPWCLGLNVGGFAIISLCGGETGRHAFEMYWPAIVAGTLAFTAIFHLIGGVFSRPAIIALLYAFFFETILSELPVPGTLKRLSINYYTRCILYSEAEQARIPTESAALFVPVSPGLAWLVLVVGTVLITVIGMAWFARLEIRDDG